MTQMVDYSPQHMGRHVTVFCWSRSVPGAADGRWEQAEKLGALLARRGFGLVTGGYCGSMEAVSKGARLTAPAGPTSPAVSAKASKWVEGAAIDPEINKDFSVSQATNGAVPDGAFAPVLVRGILAGNQFPDRTTQGNRYLTEAIDAGEMLKRLSVLCSMTRYYVALPGTLGTLTELVLIWQQAALYPAAMRPVVIAFRDPWEAVIKSCGALLQLPDGQVNTVIFCDTVEEAVAIIEQDWVRSGGAKRGGAVAEEEKSA